MHGTILYWDNFRALGRTSSIQHIALSTNVLVDRWSEQFDATELVLYNNCLRSITFVTNDTFPLASREYCKAITGLKTESEADDKVFPGAEEYLEAFKEALTVVSVFLAGGNVLEASGLSSLDNGAWFTLFEFFRTARNIANFGLVLDYRVC